jgi:hypothetical protein
MRLLATQLSAGLSTEHISRPATEEKVKEANLDADAAIAAKYYVNQILNTDEEGIREAWKKVRQYGMHVLDRAFRSNGRLWCTFRASVCECKFSRMHSSCLLLIVHLC